MPRRSRSISVDVSQPGCVSMCAGLLLLIFVCHPMHRSLCSHFSRIIVDDISTRQSLEDTARARVRRSNLCISLSEKNSLLTETNERSSKWSIRWLRMIDELTKWFGKTLAWRLSSSPPSSEWTDICARNKHNALEEALWFSHLRVSRAFVSIVVHVITEWAQIEIDVILDSFDIYYLCLCVNLNWRRRMGICSSNLVTSHHTLTFFCFLVAVHSRSHFDGVNEWVSECRCIYQKPCFVNRHEHMDRSKLKCDAVYSA